MLESLKDDLSEREYEYELLLALWWSVHNENMEIA